MEITKARILRMETPEEIAVDFVRVNLGSYLTGAPGCDLEWIKLIIGISGVRPGDLANLFIDMDGIGDKRRYRRIFKICRNAKFNGAILQ